MKMTKLIILMKNGDRYELNSNVDDISSLQLLDGF